MLVMALLVLAARPAGHFVVALLDLPERARSLPIPHTLGTLPFQRQKAKGFVALGPRSQLVTMWIASKNTVDDLAEHPTGLRPVGTILGI
jgi:hypothetical protein